MKGMHVHVLLSVCDYLYIAHCTCECFSIIVPSSTNTDLSPSIATAVVPYSIPDAAADSQSLASAQDSGITCFYHNFLLTGNVV